MQRSLPGPRRPGRQLPRRHRVRDVRTLWIAVVYLELYVVPYWGFWAVDGTRIAGKGGDPATDAWFIGWVGYDVEHLHNPLDH